MVNGAPVEGPADLDRRKWASAPAGVAERLSILAGTETGEAGVRTGGRGLFLTAAPKQAL